MESNPVKLPPNFDLRAANCAAEWKFWKCLFEDYLVAIGQEEATDKVKLSLLRNMMGPESTKVILTFKLSKEDALSYQKVVEAIDKYVNPKCNDVFERFKFNERRQAQDESFDNFYTSLRQLLSTCNYSGETKESIEDQLLRDRIVQGIADKSLQESLLRREGLTLDKVADICRASEVSRLQVKEMNPTIEIDAAKAHKYGGSSTAAGSGTEKFDCRRCQKCHGPKQCPAYGKKCTKCGILNHFAVSCRVRNAKVREVKYSDSDSCESLFCGVVNLKNPPVINKYDWREYIQIEDQRIYCKLDCGADVSVMPRKVFEKINKGSNLKLQQTDMNVESFTGETVQPLGMVNLLCKYKDIECYENFVVVDCNITLLGLPGCVSLNLIKRVHAVEIDSKDKESFIKQNIEVFEGIGRLPGNVEIPTKSMEEQICHPSPRLPTCLLDPLKSELKRLEDRNAIIKVDSIKENACVNRIVIVEKPNGNVRLCLDPSDLNKFIVKKPKILPTLDDLSLKLKGKKYFSVLDLTEGFHHLLLTEESSWKCCFATPHGVYRYLVLPFGLMNAPELFQDVLESHFGELENVVVWADDILIMGNSVKEHDQALSNVIKKAKDLGIVFNRNKFQYRQTEVRYVGQVFNENGMSLDKDRIESLVRLKEPTNRDELRQILGSFNYVRRYISNMASLMAPLCKLLKKDKEFNWLPTHRLAFAELKRKVCTAPALSPFDTNKKIVLQCDASKSGLGCCLFQKNDNDVLKLVACASRTMNETELNYSQTEKEFLSICFAAKKFHRYIYGSDVDVQTDHKPIVSIMTKPICKIGSPRLKRLRLKLLMYNLNVFYVPGKLLHFADMLSRNCLKNTGDDDNEKLHMVHTVSEHLPMSPERKESFVTETINDPILYELKKYYFSGWPEEGKMSKECRDYYKLKDNIYFESELAFYENKIIVPKSLRSYVVNLIHEGHPGICKSIRKARQLFYWPKMATEIRNFVIKCRTCEKFSSSNPHDVLLSHKIPNRRYAKLGTDILEFSGKFFLVIVDYFSHWLEIRLLNDKTSKSVIDAFQEVFTRFGYPEQLVADNNPFNSFECKQYYKSKDIILTTSSPHYPRSNGMAEKAVHISKIILKKAHEDRVDYRDYILSYNNTPLSGMEVSPSQILNSRRVRTLIPTSANLLQPKVQNNVYKFLLLKQATNEKQSFVRKKEVSYEVGDKIVYKTDKESVWKKGKIVSKCREPRSYLIQKDGDNKVIRRNIKHLKKSYSMNTDSYGNACYLDEESSCNILKTNGDSQNENNNNVSKSDVKLKFTRRGRVVKPRQILDL